jgi:signal transduction histidine kinase/HAMP domain-containing protein
MHSTPSATFRHLSRSIVSKVGAAFLLLILTTAGCLLTTWHLAGQLIGTSAAINEAGGQRMRVYKLALLLSQLHDPAMRQTTRAAMREEIQKWNQVLEGLQYGNASHNAIASANPELVRQLQTVKDRWELQLRPTLEQALHDNPTNLHLLEQQYQHDLDDLKLDLNQMVHMLEQDAGDRIQALNRLLLMFLLLSLCIIGLTVLVLRRTLQTPLKQLVGKAERLASGDFTDVTSHPRGDELGRVGTALETMAYKVRHKIEELQALHSVCREVAALGHGDLDQVLHGIVDHAAAVSRADFAALLVRHPSMNCWILDAISGVMFDAKQKEIWLTEETPFSNQAYEERAPVIVPVLSDHADTLVKIRDVYGAKSLLAVPLMAHQHCLGVLMLCSTTQTRQFTTWDVGLAEQFASYAAVTLENVRLFHELESETNALSVKLTAVEHKVAALTHEVKAPAGRVAEFATWIEQDYGSLLGEHGQRYLSWIKKEGRDLAQLAERTLDLARLTHEPLDVETVDVFEAAGEVLQLLDGALQTRGVRITVEPDLPRLACRRIHVKQVLENLVSNAIKYMGGQSEPHVEIGAMMSNQDRLIYVRDNGMGMDPAMTEHIFSPFARLAGPEISGAGIGLVIVKTVVEQYKGRVFVDTVPGKGSTFYVQLPTVAVLEEKPAAHLHPEQAGQTIPWPATTAQDAIRSRQVNS